MKKYQKKHIKLLPLFFGAVFFLSLCVVAYAQALSQNQTVDTTSTSATTKVAPGELLPIFVKLLNFGGGHKVDANITYSITDSQGSQIYVGTETVAVETTATFTKNLQLPFNAKPGMYTAKTSVFYQGQLAPADTQFSFTVEPKIFGVFKSDFYSYGGIGLILGLVFIALVNFLAGWHQKTRMAPFDYSGMPYGKRVFFELLSDTIMQMRMRVGDAALQIAANIPGISINAKTGKVLKITDDPSKIIARLVSGYDKVLGKKVSFSFRPEK